MPSLAGRYRLLLVPGGNIMTNYREEEKKFLDKCVRGIVGKITHFSSTAPHVLTML